MSENVRQILATGTSSTSKKSHSVLPANKRVAAYCRVSTDSDQQQTSFDTQVEAFRDQIKHHPGWELVDVYADEGFTGTSVKKRKEFQRMIKDAEEGKIDLLLVKSISRFARNTMECLEYVRLLQSYGTQMIFEKEGIDTGSAFSEMLLTVLAAFAQEESRSISENLKWGFRKKFEEGKPRWRNIYGYRKGESNVDWLIEPAEAAVIHEAFDRYEHGESCAEIARWFQSMRYPSPGSKMKGESKWDASVVHAILTNEKYVGDFLMQKRYVVDHLSHREVRNDQTLIPSYYARDHHKAIISRAQFERVNKIMVMKNTKLGSVQYPYDDKLVCPICGKRLIQRRLEVLDARNAWLCDRDDKACGMYALKATIIDEAVLNAYKEVDMSEVEAQLTSVRKAQKDTAQMLIDMKKKHKWLKKVDYYWVDDLIDRITFGEGQTMTVHWKCGVKTTVDLPIRHRRENPIHAGEVYQSRKAEETLPQIRVHAQRMEKKQNVNVIELSKETRGRKAKGEGK